MRHIFYFAYEIRNRIFFWILTAAFIGGGIFSCRSKIARQQTKNQHRNEIYVDSSPYSFPEPCAALQFIPRGFNALRLVTCIDDGTNYICAHIDGPVIVNCQDFANDKDIFWKIRRAKIRGYDFKQFLSEIYTL